MIVLGIESSCDETAAAVVDGTGARSDVVASQVDLHARWGGVVPELAGRAHLDKIGVVVDEALERAGCGLAQIEGVAVTRAPGLAGALLVGLSYAKALAWVRGLPLVGVHHLEGHMFAPFIGPEPPEWPFAALLVSGGHTGLYLARGPGDTVRLGETRDDAAGEAFDKGARMLGLPYPGGVAMDHLAVGGDPRAIAFPRGLKARSSFEFSFSGLKTALRRHIDQHGVPSGQALQDLCASYQEAIVEVLVTKSVRAVQAHGLSRLVVSGGVAANRRLRARMEEAVRASGIALHVPPPRRCTDNAVMIAYAGRLRLVRGQRDGLDLSASPTEALPLG